MTKMSHVMLVQLPLTLMLSSCSVMEGIFNHEIRDDSANISVEFPLEFCGDTLPEDPQAYPLELYTVFIDGTENRQLIEEKYCQNALFFHAPNSGIQLATFIGRERAEQFQEIVSQDLENVQITGPEIIRGESGNQSSSPDNLETREKFETTEEIAKAALLSEMQMQELLAIDRSEASMGSRKYTIKVVVPTYIPQGFELTQLDVRTQVLDLGSDYNLWYKNLVNNQCFGFRGGFIAPIGGGAALSAVVTANSRALGPVPIISTSSVRMGDRVSYVRFHQEQFTGKTSDNENFGDFQFSSPSYGFDEEPCEPMSFVEAVKVAESFEFLQP